MAESKKLDPEDIDNYFNENRSIRDTASHFNITIGKVWNIILDLDDGDDGLQLATDYWDVRNQLIKNKVVEDYEIYDWFYCSINQPPNIEDIANQYDISIDKVWEIIIKTDGNEEGLKRATDYYEVKEELSSTKEVKNERS